MGRESGAARRKIDHAWIGLGIGNELGDRLCRKRWIYQHDKGHADDARDRRDVADEVEIELVVERRVDRVRRRGQQQRIAVGWRTNDRFGTDIGAPARTVLNDEWLAKRSDNHWPIRRTRISAVPPAAVEMMIRTGRVG